MRIRTCGAPFAGPGLWFSVHVVGCTGSTLSRQMSGAKAGSGGEGKGLGGVELTVEGLAAWRKIWGDISDAKIADLARRIEVGALSSRQLKCSRPSP